MEDWWLPILTAAVPTIVAWLVRKVELGKWRGLVHAVVAGIEEGTKALPKSDATAVKKKIQAKAELTGAQARLHAIVDRITKEAK